MRGRFLAGAILCLLVYLLAQFAQAQQFQNAVRYTNITGDTTTVVKGAAGILHRVCFNTATATEVVTLFDNTAASGTKIGTITLPAGPTAAYCLMYDLNFTTGLTVLTATAASDITVTWE